MWTIDSYIPTQYKNSRQRDLIQIGLQDQTYFAERVHIKGEHQHSSANSTFNI